MDNENVIKFPGQLRQVMLTVTFGYEAEIGAESPFEAAALLTGRLKSGYCFVLDGRIDVDTEDGEDLMEAVFDDDDRDDLMSIFTDEPDLVERYLAEVEPERRTVWAAPGESHPPGEVGVPEQLRGDLKGELWGLINSLRDRLLAGATTDRVTTEALDERVRQMDLDLEGGADEQTFLNHREWLRDALQESLQLDRDEEWDDDMKRCFAKLLCSIAPIPLEPEDAARYVEEHVTSLRHGLKQMFLSLLGDHPTHH